MKNKVFVMVIPLILSSMVRMPGTNYDSPQAKPIFTVAPFDPITTSSTPSATGDYFNCGIYGPFSLDDLHNVDVNFTYELPSVSTQFVIERIRLLNSSGSVVASSAKEETYYYSGHRVTVTFTLPLVNYWTANGLTLKFEIVKSSDRSILKTYQASFYPPSNSNIAGTYLKRNIYASKSLGFYGSNRKMNELIETYDFTNFGDYLNVDYYYRLDIKDHAFTYQSPVALICKSAYLYFNDSDNLFPYYTHQENGDIVVPIKIVANGRVMTFKYDRYFYINKRTLQISDTYHQGFAMTEDFYLPINGRTKFTGKQIYFQLNQLGLDSISTTIPIRYDTSKSLVGICKDGDYCIIGGKR